MHAETRDLRIQNITAFRVSVGHGGCGVSGGAATRRQTSSLIRARVV
jgi:hypothetical protein